jgi:hypothetical protein
MAQKFVVTVQDEKEETETIVRQLQGFGIFFALLAITKLSGMSENAMLLTSLILTILIVFTIFTRKQKKGAA